MDERTILVLVNLVVCAGGIFMCACRLTHAKWHNTKPEVLIGYYVWFPTFWASALSWTYAAPPNIAQISLGLAIFTHMAIGYEAWRFGLPAYARREQPQQA